MATKGSVKGGFPTYSSVESDGLAVGNNVAVALFHINLIQILNEYNM